MSTRHGSGEGVPRAYRQRTAEALERAWIRDFPWLAELLGSTQPQTTGARRSSASGGHVGGDAGGALGEPDPVLGPVSEEEDPDDDDEISLRTSSVAVGLPPYWGSVPPVVLSI